MTQPTETRTTTFPDSDDVVATQIHADGTLTATCTRPDGVVCATVYVPRAVPLADVPDVVAVHRPANGHHVGTYAMEALDPSMATMFRCVAMFDVTAEARGAAA